MNPEFTVSKMYQPNSPVNMSSGKHQVNNIMLFFKQEAKGNYFIQSVLWLLA